VPKKERRGSQIGNRSRQGDLSRVDANACRRILDPSRSASALGRPDRRLHPPIAAVPSSSHPTSPAVVLLLTAGRHGRAPGEVPGHTGQARGGRGGSGRGPVVTNSPSYNPRAGRSTPGEASPLYASRRGPLALSPPKPNIPCRGQRVSKSFPFHLT
jgi:hypothetical protein